VSILAWIFLKEPIYPFEMIAMGFSFTGVILTAVKIGGGETDIMDNETVN